MKFPEFTFRLIPVMDRAPSEAKRGQPRRCPEFNEMSQRGHLSNFFKALGIPQFNDAVREDRAWRNGVDRNPVRSEFSRQKPGQPITLPLRPHRR